MKISLFVFTVIIFFLFPLYFLSLSFSSVLRIKPCVYAKHVLYQLNYTYICATFSYLKKLFNSKLLQFLKFVSIVLRSFSALQAAVLGVSDLRSVKDTILKRKK